MAQIEGRPTLALRVVISLSEEEAGALDALIGYGIDSFLEVFYAKMGRNYLEPYEKGLRSLFEARGSLSALIDRADNARKVFSGECVAIVRRDGRTHGPAHAELTAQSGTPEDKA